MNYRENSQIVVWASCFTGHRLRLFLNYVTSIGHFWSHSSCSKPDRQVLLH